MRQKIIIGATFIIVFLIGVSGYLYMEKAQDEGVPPELTLRAAETGSVQDVSFISWSEAEKNAWNPDTLEDDHGEPITLESGFNFVHVSEELAGTTLLDIKKLIDPAASNVLIFTYKNGTFVGEKSGPYNPAAVAKDVDSVPLKAGDTIIIIAQNQGSIYGVLSATEPADSEAKLAKGWNFVSLTDEQFSSLLKNPASFKGAASVWILSDEAKADFKNALELDAAQLSAVSNFVAWIKSK